MTMYVRYEAQSIHTNDRYRYWYFDLLGNHVTYMLTHRRYLNLTVRHRYMLQWLKVFHYGIIWSSPTFEVFIDCLKTITCDCLWEFARFCGLFCQHKHCYMLMGYQRQAEFIIKCLYLLIVVFKDNRVIMCIGKKGNITLLFLITLAISL